MHFGKDWCGSSRKPKVSVTSHPNIRDVSVLSQITNLTFFWTHTETFCFITQHEVTAASVHYYVWPESRHLCLKARLLLLSPAGCPHLLSVCLWGWATKQSLSLPLSQMGNSFLQCFRPLHAPVPLCRRTGTSELCLLYNAVTKAPQAFSLCSFWKCCLLCPTRTVVISTYCELCRIL